MQSKDLYAFLGTQNSSIPPEQVDQMEAKLEKYKIPHPVFRYDGSNHGFFCDRRASYNSKALTSNKMPSLRFRSSGKSATILGFCQQYH